jgi:FkbM family methyltransferase
MVSTEQKRLRELLCESQIGQENELQKVVRSPFKTAYSTLLTLIADKSRTTYRVKTKIFSGDEIVVVFPDAIASTIYRRGYLDEGLATILIEYLKPGDIFIDAGANIGYYTLLASTIVGKYGSVHSFEPTPSSFDVLKVNCANRNNVVLNKCAVFSEETVLSFNDYGPKDSTRNSFVAARFSEKKALEQLKPKKISVPAISLDKYVAKKNIVPNFIKIDVESAEYFVLKGLSQTIKDYRPIITIEVGDLDIDNIVCSRTCLEYLIERGYGAFEYRNGSIVKHQLKERYSYADILLLPE